MTSETPRELITEEEEEAQAKLNIWKYIFGFVEMAVVKCAIELGVPEAIENHGGPMTLSELSSALGMCSFTNLPHHEASILIFLMLLPLHQRAKVVENVGGDMFQCVPKADAAFLMWVLHDWGDEECIHILKKCREAIPEDKGKVIIVEAVLEEGKEENKLKDVRLMLDMVMMAHTDTGKERTLREWDYVIKEAGFSHYTVKPIRAVQSVIIAFP
ncbi:O-methyltransferase family protein [Quillaja saponaria]|uniref:O-methyltransferase family protein n=1 Tax=Quillaja saponaria TaxID=32244 RepID=A0AAD7QFN9_QUISA|nr:O-methyltransferase family protein [Quillaja saponaria]